MQQLPLGVRLRERARFANFVAGRNAAALTAMRAAASGERDVLLLLGAKSSGKSHLLLAAIADASERGLPVRYVACRELHAAGAAGFSGHSAARIVCIDDVDAIARDRDFGRALFAIWRDAEERGAALVFAARELPLLSDWGLADLGSRLRGAAQHFDLHALEESQHKVVLMQRARALGLELGDDVYEYLARRLPRDLGAQCDFLDALDQAALAAQRRLTVPFVREVLAER